VGFLGGKVRTQVRNRAILVFLLELVLFLPASGPWMQVDRGYKSSEDYWRSTELSESELIPLLESTNCQSSAHTFLGCVNAISAMSERYKLTLNIKGELSPLDLTKSDALYQTEKQKLNYWQDIYKNKGETALDINFLSLWYNLKSRYLKQEEASAVVAQGINGYFAVIFDPHTYILPIEFYEEVVAKSDGRLNHFGFLVKKTNKRVVIRKVFEKSSADKAGVKKGDEIIEINGTPIVEMTNAEFYDSLKARTGSRIGLTVSRKEGQSASLLYIDVIKYEENLPTVTSQIISDAKKVGLVTIHKFARQTCDNTKFAINNMKRQGVGGLLLDLRDNPGGQVDEAACVLGLFLPAGSLLFETRYADLSKKPDQYVNDNSPIFKGPVAVLINASTASASEIVAGVLKDYNRATLVGERTFGKGSFQDGRVWSTNDKVALFKTEGLYYFPSGWTPQLVGLEPDITVDFYSDGSQREEDLYFNPLRPQDSWNGPQSLAWLSQMKCNPAVYAQAQAATNNSTSFDPQIFRAQTWLSCLSDYSAGTQSDTY
jgi:carboxyl-terminal processing protease